MSYILSNKSKINMPSKSNNPVIGELFSNYTYGEKYNIDFTSDNCTITLDNFVKAERGDCEYIIKVTDGGVYINGKNFPAVMRGFVTFLECIKYNETNSSFYVKNLCRSENPDIPFRASHLCIFPETKKDLLKKCIRACALTKYSHIILEFWGMLKLDCMKELAWDCAYEKSEIKEILNEAAALGIEIIPMFNHLGHASSCRTISGKHVVLDQNPRYEYMFDAYGWVWDISREDVQCLHKAVRRELIELCGDVKYFHIGCDEAYLYGHNEEKARKACEYINNIASELKSQGIRPIMWHDMMLAREDYTPNYYVHSTKTVSEIFMNSISKDILIADWEYEPIDDGKIWETSKTFKKKGFEVVGCPWNGKQNVINAVDTVKELNLYGIIETTWHTLHLAAFRDLVFAGKLSYGTGDSASNAGDLRDMYEAYAAHIVRKAMPSGGNYANSGWYKVMTGPGMW